MSSVLIWVRNKRDNEWLRCSSHLLYPVQPDRCCLGQVQHWHHNHMTLPWPKSDQHTLQAASRAAPTVPEYSTCNPRLSPEANLKRPQLSPKRHHDIIQASMPFSLYFQSIPYACLGRCPTDKFLLRASRLCVNKYETRATGSLPTHSASGQPLQTVLQMLCCHTQSVVPSHKI
jgi:hypothetical protein